MQTRENEPLYNPFIIRDRWDTTNSITILCLIFFFPLGLFLMWKFSRWSKVSKIVVSAFIAIMCITIIGRDATKVSNQPVATETVITEAEYKVACEKFDYKLIARNPADYKTKNIVISGKVIQVSKGLFDTVTLWIATKESEYGEYTDEVYIVTYKQVDINRMLKDDMVTIWGLGDDVTTYEGKSGGNITIPSMEMKYYEILE
jgi:hypothetical protein